MKLVFWIIIAGSIKEVLLLINISFAANFPRIFVDCTAIAAWIIAMGPYGNNDTPLVKGAVNKINFLIRLKDVKEFMN